MLSQQDLFSHRKNFANGFVNTASLSGVARGVTAERFYIQQGANENHMLPVIVPRDVELPRWVRDYQPVKALCRIRGDMDQDGGRSNNLTLLYLDRPTVLDMPAHDAWLEPVPEGAPRSNFKPSDFGIISDRRSNRVRIAGYLSGSHINRTLNPATGEVGERYLIMLIQQNQFNEKALVVRYKHFDVAAIQKAMPLGCPLLIDGWYRAKATPLDMPPDENGIVPVQLNYFIEVNGKPKLATRDDIQEIPDWAAELAQSSGLMVASRRKTPVESSGRQGVTDIVKGGHEDEWVTPKS